MYFSGNYDAGEMFPICPLLRDLIQQQMCMEAKVFLHKLHVFIGFVY